MCWTKYILQESDDNIEIEIEGDKIKQIDSRDRRNVGNEYEINLAIFERIHSSEHLLIWRRNFCWPYRRGFIVIDLWCRN